MPIFWGGGGAWKLRGNEGLSWDPNTNFGLNSLSLDNVLVQSFPPLLVFWDNHCVSEKFGKS